MNTMNLPVRLTTDELLLRCDEMAKKLRDAAEIEVEMKAAAAKSKAELGKVQAEIALLARVVRDKKEYRDVEVFEVKNFERLTMDTYRRDTGELVAFRALSLYERNEPLFSLEEESAPEPVTDPAPEQTPTTPEPDPGAPAVIPAEEPIAAEPAAAAEPIEKLAN